MSGLYECYSPVPFRLFRLLYLINGIPRTAIYGCHGLSTRLPRDARPSIGGELEGHWGVREMAVMASEPRAWGQPGQAGPRSPNDALACNPGRAAQAHSRSFPPTK